MSTYIHNNDELMHLIFWNGERVVIKFTHGICITKMHTAQNQVSTERKKGKIIYHGEQL
jgi:hypothetical protein